MEPSTPIHTPRVAHQLITSPFDELYFLNDYDAIAHRFTNPYNPELNQRITNPYNRGGNNRPSNNRSISRFQGTSGGQRSPNGPRNNNSSRQSGNYPFNNRIDERCAACAYYGHGPTSCRALARFASIMRYYTTNTDSSNTLADHLHAHLNERSRRAVARALIQGNPAEFGHMDEHTLANSAPVEDILMQDFR